jgi:hypothetical protein
MSQGVHSLSAAPWPGALCALRRLLRLRFSCVAAVALQALPDAHGPVKGACEVLPSDCEPAALPTRARTRCPATASLRRAAVARAAGGRRVRWAAL